MNLLGTPFVAVILNCKLIEFINNYNFTFKIFTKPKCFENSCL